LKTSTFTLALAGVAAVAAGGLWLGLWMTLGLPRFPWAVFCVHALVIFGLGARLKKTVLPEFTPEKFLIRLIALYAITTAAVLVGYFEWHLRSGNGGPETSPAAVSFWAGVIVWWVVRLIFFPPKRTDSSTKRTGTRSRPDYGTDLRTGKDARALAQAALGALDSGLYWGGAHIQSCLARLGFLLVGSIGSGKTTLLRLLLQSVNALPAIKPGTDCRAWILDVKREMFPIVRGIVGDQCPVIDMLPTDLRSRKWRICDDVKDDATCLQFAGLFAPGQDRGDPFWISAVQTLFYACLIYLTRRKIEWDLRDVVLILDDEELTGQVVERVRDNHYVRQLFEPEVTWRSIRVTLAVLTKELRLIAAMWDHATEEVSLDWWSRNPAILVVGTDSTVDKTLKVLIRMMFKRTSELLLAQAPDPTGRRFNWVVLDELPALGQLVGLSDLCLRGRAGGNIVVATITAVGHIRQHYKDEAEGLLGQFFNRALLRTDDVATAEWEEKCVGNCDMSQWFGNEGTSWSPYSGQTTNRGRSEQRVTRPAFPKEDFQNMPPASAEVGIPGVWKSYLGEENIDKDGIVRKVVTTWFDILSREATFDKLVPSAADTPDFIPRPPEHQHLRPFTRADYVRLKLTPPSGFMKGTKKRS
jgi:hypothetical protein